MKLRDILPADGAQKLARFIPEEEINSTTCIEWQGAYDKSGYPVCRWKGKHKTVRRLLWNLVYGEMPEGLLASSTCGNGRCVNIYHISPRTIHGALSTSPKMGAKNYCKNGHPFSRENTQWKTSSTRTRKDGTPIMQRVCRTCAREHRKKYREKRRGK